MNQSTHWADITADKIIREKGDRTYVCASGITPSGTVHIGNFREIISVALVAQALREKGKDVRFIYSWDDYDVFRKVPKNMPQPELLETYLRKPITLVPDVKGDSESYAQANEKAVEKWLPVVGINPEYIYQAQKYRQSDYAEGIRTALANRDRIVSILNEHRTQPLADKWMPVSLFCSSCDKDTTEVLTWDGEWGVEYSCSSCENHETVDLRETPCAKLPWRIDWPMRWKVEQVDFEPAGKDHHSEGGSFDTAIRVASEVYGTEAPVTFQYDFVSMKGRGGKMSSSSGELISLPDVLEVYTPEVTRFLFAGTRPNTEFAISFDLDVLKIYEDYEKLERSYFNPPESEKQRKKWAKGARIYELSQVDGVPAALPYQIPIRHLCNLLQIMNGDIEAVINYLGDLDEEQKKRFRIKATCAWNWIREFAPEDFQFALQTPGTLAEGLTDLQKEGLRRAAELARTRMPELDEKSFSTELYDMLKEIQLESSDFFPAVYRALIAKEKGPRLISFLYTIGAEKVAAILEKY